jgi:hypothetical protein
MLEPMSGDQKNQKHQVLISRSIAPGYNREDFVHPNANILWRSIYDAERLKEYDLVILPYSEFEERDGGNPHKKIFEKQMLEALGCGTAFCFVHHSESCPGNWSEYSNNGYMPNTRVGRCLDSQAGFRWLNSRQIRI